MSRTDIAALSLDATRRDVYAALLDPRARATWLPPAGMSGTISDWDARVGGGYRMVLTYADASDAPGKSSADTDVVEARFVRLEPDELVAEEIDFTSDDLTFAGTMTMSWTLESDRGRTTVTITAEDVPPGIDAVDHLAGLTSSLEQLAAYVRGTRSH
ncbi:MAG: SRPBCC domain-containing protein [Aeromicrobium sp.]